MKYILSYGGGVNSSALFFYLLEQNKPLDVVVFADTGEETKETYNAVDRIKFICEQKNILFQTVKSQHGNLYDYYYNKKAVMSVMRRDCTGKFKVAPIRKFIREKYGKKETFTMYIAIAWDEMHRMRTSDVKYIVNSYPFCDNRIGREDNKAILKKNNFVAEKSGCKGCMYLKKKQWLNMLINNPVEFARHKALEENGSRYPEITLNPNFSLADIEKSNTGQTALINIGDDVETSCDVSGSCFL